MIIFVSTKGTNPEGKTKIMTALDLKANREEIISEYYALGGNESMLKDFMTVLVNAVDFELNDNENTIDLVHKMFSYRFAGKTEKSEGLRGIMGNISLHHENKGKKWKL